MATPYVQGTIRVIRPNPRNLLYRHQDFFFSAARNGSSGQIWL